MAPSPPAPAPPDDNIPETTEHEPQSQSRIQTRSRTRSQSRSRSRSPSLTLLQKRRKRVSFAETTVHLFTRDEDYQTPSDQTSTPPQQQQQQKKVIVSKEEAELEKLRRAESEEIADLLADDDGQDSNKKKNDNDGVGDSEDEDVGVVKRSFLKLAAHSPSSGSAFGSATSSTNDEGEFFGPVSMDFIKPSRLSGSAASEDNHDITMDSTVFSKHYHSLARSESGGDFKTPTAMRLPFDDGGQGSTATSPGDLMALTAARKPGLRALSSPSDNVNDSGHSDDMSLVSENPRSYDYGKLSPDLDFLLAEGFKHVEPVPFTSPVQMSNASSPMRKNSVDTLNRDNSEIKHSQSRDASSPGTMGMQRSPNSDKFASDKNTFGTGGLPSGTFGETSSDKPDAMFDETVTVTPTVDQIKAPFLRTSDVLFDQDEEGQKELIEVGEEACRNLIDAEGRLETPLSGSISNLNDNLLERSSVAGSVSSLLAKRRRMFRPSDNSLNYEQSSPLSAKDPRSVKNAWSSLSSLKSVSRLKGLEALRSASTSKAEGYASRLLPPRPLSAAKKNPLGYSSECTSIVEVDAPVARLESHFSDVAQDNTQFRSVQKEKNNKYLQKISEVCDADNSSRLKRNHDELMEEVEHHHVETLSCQTNVKLDRNQKQTEGDCEASLHIDDDTMLRNLDNVFTDFCSTTKQLYSPWIDKLELTQLVKLDDALIILEKLKSYDSFNYDKSSQRGFNSVSFLQKKREMDMKSLLCRSLYKKAQLQLRHLQRDKLLDQVKQQNSRVQESEKLLSIIQKSCVRGTQSDRCQSESFPTGIKRSSASSEISSLRNEREFSGQKIKDLEGSFHAYMKFKEQPTSTIEYVKDFLRKKIYCRSLQSELQICEVGSIENVGTQQDFIFCHSGFMSQRFSLTSRSHMSISNELNEVKISKVFHNMDAWTAFLFVLGGEIALTYEGLRTIVQERQKTSSLLHNLLDVVEEVRLAKFELRNLSHSTFCQPSAGKLDLLLCFIDFKKYMKVTLRIDVTCLKRGVYPSQALPHEVQGKAAGKDDSLQLLLNDVTAALRGLRCGYMRILNLCRCVSRIVRAL